MGDNRHPRTVLMTADTVGGVWTYAIDLSRALNQRGVEVVLATMGRRMTPDQREQARWCPGLSVIESDYRLEWMQEPWDDVRRAGEWLLGIAQKLRPDVVHLNGYAHGALPWNAPVVMMAHSCVLSWWEAVKGEPAPAGYQRYREAVAAGVQAAGIVAAPTRSMLECVERHYGRPRKTRVIPNGRDASHYRPADKEPFVLAAGRLWDEAKNIATLGSAAPGLDWPIVVAGDDLHPDGSRRPPANVLSLGRVSANELAGWFGRAGMYVLPARYEPFGLSVLEAALSGCALVLGDIATLRENWSGAAVFVEPDDSSALHAAIDVLIRNAPMRTAMAQRARQRAAAFTTERMAQGWLDDYEDARGDRSLRSRLGSCEQGGAERCA